ncbi:hypothetical protein [Plasmodium yoelii yoelii]|uniref:Uncharacterized protein n=1 Tax=Plasmodium yoelii yoelii TaxID=73239 RepID=Q7RS35_PLAYO|nr:hypothetical protein [Plasmodium yoelii yoelii]
MISRKFEKYINNNNVNIYGKYEKDQLKKELLERSFSNVYYIPIFNPGHLLVILNSLKKLLEKKNFIRALFIDSLSFWNFLHVIISDNLHLGEARFLLLGFNKLYIHFKKKNYNKIFFLYIFFFYYI